MPCYSDYSPPSAEELIVTKQINNANNARINAEIGMNNLQKQIYEQNNSINILNKYIELYKEKLDFITNLLCESCNKLELLGCLNELSDNHLEWWNNHKKFDENRIKGSK